MSVVDEFMVAYGDERVVKLRAALQKIAALDAEIDSADGWNEWGEAECFRKAKAIAEDRHAGISAARRGHEQNRGRRH